MPPQYLNHISRVKEWEREQEAKGVEIIKNWISITKEEQSYYLKRRKEFKPYKWSETDQKGLELFEKITHYNEETLIITRGSKGTEYKGDLYPAEKVNVFDVVGAGDTFLAALTYGYLKYGRIDKAIPLANKAAAVAVSHRGTYVLTEEDVKKILY